MVLNTAAVVLLLVFVFVLVVRFVLFNVVVFGWVYSALCSVEAVIWSEMVLQYTTAVLVMFMVRASMLFFFFLSVLFAPLTRRGR